MKKICNGNDPVSDICIGCKHSIAHEPDDTCESGCILAYGHKCEIYIDIRELRKQKLDKLNGQKY